MEVEGIFEEHKERMRGFFAGKLKRKRKGKQGAKNELFIEGGGEVQELNFLILNGNILEQASPKKCIPSDTHHTKRQVSPPRPR